MLNEYKSLEKGPQELDIQVQTIPMDVTVTSIGSGVIFSTAAYEMTVFDGKISDRDFAQYKKEVNDLFKDFDDILGEINKRYNLKKRKNG